MNTPTWLSPLMVGAAFSSSGLTGRTSRLVGLSILLLFSILASGAKGQNMRAEKIYQWGFSHVDDQNSDHWPDKWQRRRDRKHPAYIEMRISPRNAQAAHEISAAKKTLIQVMHAWETGQWNPNYIPETTPPELAKFLERTILDNCLEMHMDGGAGEIISPEFPMESRFVYRVQGELNTQDLNGHTAWIELQLLDSQGRVVDVLKSQSVAGSTDWTFCYSEAEIPSSSKLRYGRIHLKVEPHRSLHIRGRARFDNLAVYRMPRLVLSSSTPFNVAKPEEPVEVSCSAMGIKGDVDAVHFEMHEIRGSLIREASIPLRTAGSHNDTPHLVSTAPERPHYAAKAARERAVDGEAIWRFTVDQAGLYRITVNLGDNSRRTQRRALLLAVIDESEEVVGGPFGWSIPAFGPHLSPSDLPELVTRFGAGWVNYPVWFDMLDPAKADELINLTERLQAFNIQCVGRLDEPPESQRSAFGAANEKLHAITVFREEDVWEPVLEPVLTRMGMKLTWFQLGRHDDLSFMGRDDVIELMSKIRARMQTYCQELNILIRWDWLEDAPPSENSPWNAVHYTSQPQLTANELAAYAASTSGQFQETWISIDPLPASSYSLLDRVKDLTERMVEVRRAGIKAAFLSNPFDPERGLFDTDMQAGEMLIPWHRLVANVGTNAYIGSINMPNSSENHIFANGSQGVMLAWNHAGASEQLFLGKEVSAADIWGRPIPVETVNGPRGTPEQKIQIGDWPVIIQGVNVDVVRWRQRFQLQLANLASRLDSGQTLPVLLESPFPQTVSGRMTLVSESLLANGQASMQMQIPSNRQQKRALPIELRGDASTGEHQLRFDFDIEADEKYQFSVYRTVTLGLGDIQVLWDSSRRSPSQIVLRVELINKTNTPVSFDCKLFPPGQPYERFQILNAQPGSTLKEIILNVPDTGSPREHWIRCEGIGNNRILNYRVTF